MRNFVFGILFTVVVLLAGACWVVKMGYVNFSADQAPGVVEERLAMSAMDASLDRRIPQQKNPIEPTEDNLVAGAKLYLDHCAGCHGVPSNPSSKFAQSFYPTVPEFFADAPDMSENENFYVIQHGVRWTGMPAWNKTLTDLQIWQIVTFLSHIQKLPPAAQNVFGPPPPPTMPMSMPMPMAAPMTR